MPRSLPYGRQKQRRFRGLRVETLEGRWLLSGDCPDPIEPFEGSLTYDASPVSTLAISGTTGEKPQSKVWQYDNQSWSVLANSTGTWVWRLDGNAWTPVLKLSSTKFQADVKPAGNLAHILLERTSSSKLASIEYVPGSPGSYKLWSVRPSLANLPLSSSTETATLDLDSTGRMWVASDAITDIEVRYSDAPYSLWSAPIVVASNIDADDLSAIVALPNNSIGVFWSNQVTRRFGFRQHFDGAPPTDWTVDEVPGADSALNIGGGMADDHLNLAVASDGTLYAAVKTSYDKTGFTKVGLLVRSTAGTWSPLYEVDTAGTRPIVQLDELYGRILVVYRNSDTAGPIVFRESRTDAISFGGRQTLIEGSADSNPSGSKQNFSDRFVIVASTSGQASGSLINVVPPLNQAPIVNAGIDQNIPIAQLLALDGTVTDDGLPFPPCHSTAAWSKVSGPGSVSFTDFMAIDTTATFSMEGVYVLRLDAHDGEVTGSDETTVTVSAAFGNQPPGVNAGTDQSLLLAQSASLDGTVNDDGLPDPPGAIAATWSKVSGPGSVTFGDASLIDTTATFDMEGSYVLRLTAYDGELTGNDEVAINISTPPPNQAPLVNAGADQSLFLFQSATLDATVSDEGLPNPPGAFAVTWSKVSGPGNVAFADASQIDTTATFSLEGSYVLRLTAFDGELTGLDDVALSVSNAPPVTQSFQDGLLPLSTYRGTRDSRIRGNYPDINYGANSSLLIDGAPDSAALVEWDISAIPLGSLVQSASIKLSVTEPSIDTYEAYAVERPWIETEVTWNLAAAGSPWQIPGAQGTTDRSSTVLGVVTASTTGTLTLELNASGIAVVQGWVNNPASNFGFIIVDYSASDPLTFRSRESGTASTRPLLSVAYVASTAQTSTAPANAATRRPVFIRGRSDGVQFDMLYSESYYLNLYPDVQAAVRAGQFESGAQHFELYGKAEARNISLFFDTQVYLANNPDVDAAVTAGTITSGLDHFLIFGQCEGRTFSPDFSEQYYLQSNADVANAVSVGAFRSGLDHFLRYGMAEKRPARETIDKDLFSSGADQIGLYDGREGWASGQPGDDLNWVDSVLQEEDLFASW